MSSSNSPCAACKFLRRKCTQECVFAPYFPPDNPQRFTCVHKVFGASNVAKLLNELPPSQREDAVKSLAYEADARLKDPVYGCVGLISLLQQRLKQIQGELYNAKKELATYIEPQGMPPGMHAILPTGIMPQQHPSNPYITPLYPYNMGPHGGQLVIRDPQQQQQQQQHQQQQIMEAQQYAAAMAAREQQEMLRNYEQQQQQQQQEFFRFNNRGFEVGSASGAGFNNQMPTAGAPTEVLVSPSLGLAPYDQPYQIQQQQAEHHHPQPHDQLQAQAAPLLLTTQQPQQQQTHQQQPENEEGQGENAVGSSC